MKLKFIREAPTLRAAAWRALYLLDYATFRRLPGNRRRA
jgi:hypothetical protein